MSKKDFDFLFTSKPVNSTASRVMSKGEHFEPDIISDTELWSDAPPKMVNYIWDEQHDLTGKIFGYFKIIGFIKHKKKHGGIWAVKCKCGKYGNRRSSFLKKYNDKNKQDYQCSFCRFQEKIKTPEYKTGYNGHMKDIKIL